MFKFNFEPLQENVDDYFAEKETPASDSVNSESVNSAIFIEKCEEIVPQPDQFTQKTSAEADEDNHQLMMFAGGQIVLCSPPASDSGKYFSNTCTELSVQTDKQHTNHSDLIPGIYEGGGKVWECSQDLGDYLTQFKGDDGVTATSIFDTFKDAKILDLGCGPGVIGILALHGKAKTVHFQDYNKDVLTTVTIPNVLMNTDNCEHEMISRCRFYSGDWTSYIEATGNEDKFDIILTSETIYNPANYDKIIQVLSTKLKSDGCAYLAAKLYYFGVGGGLRFFEKFLQDNGALRSRVVWASTENVPREILKITHRTSDDVI